MARKPSARKPPTPKRHAGPVVRLAKLSELTPDRRNANKGTERGVGMLEHSLRKYGAGRSVLIDRKGRLIAGNKTAERAVELGLEGVIIVATDGRHLVAVQRTDLDLEEHAAAVEMAIADNRVAEVDLAWDAGVMADLEEFGADLKPFFTEKEVVSFMARPPAVKENITAVHRCPKCGHEWSGE